VADFLQRKKAFSFACHVVAIAIVKPSPPLTRNPPKVYWYSSQSFVPPALPFFAFLLTIQCKLEGERESRWMRRYRWKGGIEKKSGKESGRKRGEDVMRCRKRERGKKEKRKEKRIKSEIEEKNGRERSISNRESVC
jgi:hypothetical protein